MNTKQKVVLGTLAILVGAGTAGCGNRQPGALAKAEAMDRATATARAIQTSVDSAVATAMAQYGIATQSPGAIASTPVPTYSTTSMPAGVTGTKGVDDVYGIMIPGNRLKCCEDCSYGLLIDEVNKLTGQSGIPTYLQINDDSNTVQVEYGSKVFDLPQPEATIDLLLNFTAGYLKEVVSASGDKFRYAVDTSGHTLEEFASVLGDSYLDNLRNAYQIEFSNTPSGNAIPRVNIYLPGVQDPIQLEVTNSNGKADFDKYFQLLDIAGVPRY